METWYLRKNNFKILPYLLSVVYNINITEYYRAVSEFYATSNITAFIRFISDALSVSVAEIRDSNFAKYSDVISADYLANLLREKVIIKRQYDLLNLIKQNNLSFTQEDLQLKKPFTKLYGKVSRTTVSRDIKKFEELGLIRKTALVTDSITTSSDFNSLFGLVIEKSALLLFVLNEHIFPRQRDTHLRPHSFRCMNNRIHRLCKQFLK